MTENECIETLKMNRPFAYSELQKAIDVAITALEEIQACRAIGTVEECRTAVERMKPKKVVINNIPKTSWTKATTKYTCPSCDRVIGFTGLNYCPCCGQAIDWQLKEKIWQKN